MIVGTVAAVMMNGPTDFGLFTDRSLMVRPDLHADDILIFGRMLRLIPDLWTGPEWGYYGFLQLDAAAQLVGGVVKLNQDYIDALELDRPRQDGEFQ